MRFLIIKSKNHSTFLVSGEFNPSIVSRNGETLRQLDLRSTGLSSLQAGTFDLIPNLIDLSISSNNFEVLPSNIFGPLTQLETLNIGNSNLRNLNPEWFATLQALRRLYINGNSIFELPHNVFNGLTNLTDLFLYSNNIRVIDTESFGGSLGSLRMISAIYNEVAGVDPTLLDSAPNLVSLLLSMNNCTQLNFYDIPANRANVTADLGECFANYVGETISCEYFVSRGDYACRLTINNPIGRDSFANIPGVHIPGSNNARVTLIELVGQNTRNIPEVGN